MNREDSQVADAADTALADEFDVEPSPEMERLRAIDAKAMAEAKNELRSRFVAIGGALIAFVAVLVGAFDFSLLGASFLALVALTFLGPIALFLFNLRRRILEPRRR